MNPSVLQTRSERPPVLGDGSSDLSAALGRMSAEIQRLRDALGRTEAFLDAAQAEAGMGSWEFDCATGRGSWSREMFRLTGLDPALGPPSLPEFVAMFVPVDRVALGRGLEALVEGRPFHFAGCLVRLDGDLRFVDGHATLVGPSGSETRISGTVRDVAERRTGVDEGLRRLIDRMQEGLIAQDGDGRIVFVNRRLCEMLGFTEEELLARPTASLFDEENRRIFIDQQARRRRGERDRFAITWQCRDGSALDTEVTPNPRFDEDGTLLESVAIITDVTARRRAEEAKRIAEARLRAIVEAGPDCVKVVGLAGELLEMNPPGVAMLEATSLDEVRGRPLLSFVTPEHRPAFIALHQAVLRGEARRLEFEIEGLDGGRRWVETHAVPLREPGGAIVGLLGVTRDVTDRRQATEARRESEERLRLVLDAAGMGTFDWDIPNDRIVGSRRHEELWGIAAGAPFHTLAFFTERVHPDDGPAVEAELARCMAARQRFSREYRVVWPDSSVHWISSCGEFAFDEAGRPLRMRGVALEVTERKVTDDALRHAHGRLVSLSHRLLESQEAERRALARELHDEIGQALTAAKINLQALERSPGPDAIVERLPAAVGAIDSALQQVRSLLLGLRPPLLDDLGLASALRWLTDQSAQRTGVRVTFRDGGSEGRSSASIRTACFRVAQEAINNAIRHARASEVNVMLRAEEDRLHVRVLDDGVGFDYTAARARAVHGVSMGIVGMEERATLAGGGIEWHTAPGQGTEVHAWFPAGPANTVGRLTP